MRALRLAGAGLALSLAFSTEAGHAQVQQAQSAKPPLPSVQRRGADFQGLASTFGSSTVISTMRWFMDGRV